MVVVAMVKMATLTVVMGVMAAAAVEASMEVWEAMAGAELIKGAAALAVGVEALAMEDSVGVEVAEE